MTPHHGRSWVCSNDTCVCNVGYTGSDCSINVCFWLNSSDPRVCRRKCHCVARNSFACGWYLVSSVKAQFMDCYMHWVITTNMSPVMNWDTFSSCTNKLPFLSMPCSGTMSSRTRFPDWKSRKLNNWNQSWASIVASTRSYGIWPHGGSGGEERDEMRMNRLFLAGELEAINNGEFQLFTFKPERTFANEVSHIHFRVAESEFHRLLTQQGQSQGERGQVHCVSGADWSIRETPSTDGIRRCIRSSRTWNRYCVCSAGRLLRWCHHARGTRRLWMYNTPIRFMYNHSDVAAHIRVGVAHSVTHARTQASRHVHIVHGHWYGARTAVLYCAVLIKIKRHFICNKIAISSRRNSRHVISLKDSTLVEWPTLSQNKEMYTRYKLKSTVIAFFLPKIVRIQPDNNVIHTRLQTPLFQLLVIVCCQTKCGVIISSCENFDKNEQNRTISTKKFSIRTIDDPIMTSYT